MSAGRLEHLQRLAGNRAVTDLVRCLPKSASVRIGETDPDEHGILPTSAAGEVTIQRRNPFKRIGERLPAGVRGALAPVLGGALPTITPNVTPADNFAGRSLVRFGVGETITLSTALSAGTAATVGGLQWRKVSGPGALAAPAPDGAATFTCDHHDGAVSLVLEVASGLRIGEQVATQNFAVVKPSSGVMRQVPGTGVKHTRKKGDCGFKGDMFIGPNDVSFAGIQQREGACAATGTGSFAGWNGLPHAPSDAWKSVQPGNAANGSEVNQVDEVYSGKMSRPFTAGTFTWPIPWEWRVAGSSPEIYATATHRAVIGDHGKVSIDKAGSPTFTKRWLAPTSDY